MDAQKIIVTSLKEPSAGARRVEVVERKGKGHPDTLCDAASEAFGVCLCREYLDRCGRILHHNVDKAVLCGGSARVGFGGGEVTQPLRLQHVGRATLNAGAARIDIQSLARTSAERVFKDALRHFNPVAQLEVEALIRPTSADLASLFGGTSGVPLSNDTSMGCGYAPFSDTEKLVLATEHWLTSPETLRRHPFLGEDVKVLAVRVGDCIELTVAAAFVAEHVPSLADYLSCKEAVREEIAARAAEASQRPVKIILNAADAPERGAVYLTVTGTSAEAGDDGQVGRGNRVNGLITPFRPMTLEALAGKNPVSHVGKLYNAWAHRFTRRLVQDGEVEEAVCHLASRIGSPITEPQVVYLAVRGTGGRQTRKLTRRVHDELQTLPDMWREMVDGKWVLF